MAADKHLVADYDDNYYDYEKSESEFICWAFCFACLGEKADLRQSLTWHKNRLTPEQLIVANMIRDETSFHHIYNIDSTDRQCMRFMYIEFLALYFEDLGD